MLRIVLLLSALCFMPAAACAQPINITMGSAPNGTPIRMPKRLLFEQMKLACSVAAPTTVERIRCLLTVGRLEMVAVRMLSQIELGHLYRAQERYDDFEKLWLGLMMDDRDLTESLKVAEREYPYLKIFALPTHYRYT